MSKRVFGCACETDTQSEQALVRLSFTSHEFAHTIIFVHQSPVCTHASHSTALQATACSTASRSTRSYAAAYLVDLTVLGSWRPAQRARPGGRRPRDVASQSQACRTAFCCCARRGYDGAALPFLGCYCYSKRAYASAPLVVRHVRVVSGDP